MESLSNAFCTAHTQTFNVSIGGSDETVYSEVGTALMFFDMVLSFHWAT